MTFSLVARDATGAFGSAICSSSPAVAARCVNLADGVGAVNSQNVTDPRLGPLLLDRLRAGVPAQAALDAVTGQADDIAFRQLLVVDDEGRAAAFSGERALGIFGAAVGDGVAAGGNMLAGEGIPQAMVDAFAAATGDLEHRLLAAMRAAADAGGEAGPVHSAGLAVVRDAGWRVTDLRVDWTEGDPVAELGELLDLWMPQRDDYVTRALHPGAAPSYGVPGDE
ncbi:DUF1028 domain-containing protein [Microbacterium hominis]|uniref:DUF1028 domain-containing protein n=1 Tax=Microbacterium hominis TaxID=162426 RepID=A0A7D4UIZ0_9MICO|nr:DUF1028 domain-containing protein [Microbacterium hominis]QKJ20488.1 DUF1028 domain-containing protein [Microbacterium hominis]